MSELPQGWEETAFGDLFDFKGGSQPPKATFSSSKGYGLVRLLQIRDFESDDKAVFIKDDPKWPKCAENDIMIGRYGASIGKVLSGKAGAYNVALVKWLFDELITNRRWVWYLLKSDAFQAPLSLLSRSAQNGFNKNDISSFPLLLPPLAEQRRIAAKLDNLFARTRRTREELEHIPRLVEHYKQAILAAAFRGDLTKDWREATKPAIPPGVLQLTIDNAREEAVARISGRSKKPLEPDWFPQMELPGGWLWCSIDQLTSTVQYGTSAKTSDDLDDGIPVIRMGNIVDGRLDFTKLKYLPHEHDEFPELLLEDGDILFNRTNSAELVGKTAVYRHSATIKASFASYLIRLQTTDFFPELLSAYINSPFGREWVASVASQQVGQANVNGTKLRQLAVPVMPPEEQREIWKRVDRAFKHINALQVERVQAQKLLDHLDQSYLAKAFRGELVPQDPNDEPASILLERIRAEREEQNSKEIKRKRVAIR